MATPPVDASVRLGLARTLLRPEAARGDMASRPTEAGVVRRPAVPRG